MVKHVKRHTMNETALAVLLLLLGGITARIWLTGDYIRYVKPGLWPLLAAASLTLIAIATATLWFQFGPARTTGRHRSQPHQSNPTHHSGHGHTVDGWQDHQHAPTVAWMLLLPVLALALLAPPALGADAANHAGTALTQPTGDFPPLPDGDPVPLTLMDYASRAVFDEGQSIGDRTIQLTGFVTLGPDGQPYLTRMVLTCCAADARPIKVGLDGDVPADLAADAWVQVIGTYTPRKATDEINAGIIPFLQTTSVSRIDEPDDPYSN